MTNPHNEFIAAIDQTQVVEAIGQAEAKTSGEIRVFISKAKTSDPLKSASVQFKSLGMHQTQLRNGVLIFVAPASRNFALIGDEGIHQKCGANFWTSAAAHMEVHLRAGEVTRALVGAIQEIGTILQQHFPRAHTDKNELPDALSHD